MFFILEGVQMRRKNMKKENFFRVLRIVVFIIACVGLGFLTITIANKISALVLKFSQKFFGEMRENFMSYIGFGIAMLVGSAEVKAIFSPLFAKIFKHNTEKVIFKSVILSVGFMLAGIMVGLATMYVVHIFSLGVNMTTEFIFDMTKTKWKSLLGVVILALIGFLEVSLIFKKIKKKKKDSGKTNEINVKEIKNKENGTEDLIEISDEILKNFS